MSDGKARAMKAEYLSTAPGLGSDLEVARAPTADRRWWMKVKQLRRGRVIADEDWDRVYPAKYIELSRLHWSPVEVARRAAELLSRGTETRVLDVGAGVGKFCVIAAVTTPGLFVGVERSGEMVDVARATAHRARTSRTRFIHAHADDIDWMNFNGFYFFNPFGQIRWPDLRMSGPSLPQPAEYQRLISFTQASLAASRRGTRVVTYFGFGGEMPRCFRLTLKQPYGTDFIECWERE
jgi:SAM-dependent methyltransferase